MATQGAGRILAAARAHTVTRPAACVLQALTGLIVCACSSGNPVGPTSVSIGMQLNTGAPIAGVTVVTFKAVVSPKPSTDGTVTWRFTDDGSTGTGATITHVFAPRLPGGPGAPGLCPVADPTSGGWVVYQASASFSGF